MSDNIHKLDLGATVAADPWGSVGVAFAAGACLALVEPRSRLGRALASTLGAIVLAAVRQAVVTRIAKSWTDQSERITPRAQA
jgi:hypothetical protein